VLIPSPLILNNSNTYEKTNTALGSNCPAAYPDHEKYDLEYEKKIELDLKRAPIGGGCG